MNLVKHKYKHLGYGMCRGAKWTDRVWPIMRGPRSLQECANSCGRTKGCIAFDVSGGQGSGKQDCMLYGHRHPVPAPGVPGDCYTIPGAVFIEEMHPEEEEVTSRRAAILNEDQEEETNIGKITSWVWAKVLSTVKCIQRKLSYLGKVPAEELAGKMANGRLLRVGRPSGNVLTSVKSQLDVSLLTCPTKMERNMTAFSWATPACYPQADWQPSVTSLEGPNL